MIICHHSFLTNKPELVTALAVSNVSLAYRTCENAITWSTVTYYYVPSSFQTNVSSCHHLVSNSNYLYISFTIFNSFTEQVNILFR